MIGHTESEQKAARARVAAKRRGLYCIEGETMDMDQMAARLGISGSLVRSRMRDARGEDGPLTWARLGGVR